MNKKMTIDSLFEGRKKQFRNARFTFKCDKFSVETDARYERFNPKSILPFEEFDKDKLSGKRVKAKLVGYNKGEKTYFPAIQDEKGKWIADISKPAVPGDRVEKAVMDKRTEEVKLKDTLKGLWFKKVTGRDILTEWLIEDTFNIWSEENSDNLLKVYLHLSENEIVGVYKFNPNGTVLHAFLVPQRIDGGRFRLLLQVARVRTNKPEISPTMTIASAQAREREKTRVERTGMASALEEI
jgi:hypothetical protein